MKTSPRILLVEDNEDDSFLTERVLRKAGLRTIFNAVNGRIALEYLQGMGTYGDRVAHPLPEIILLDLKLPEVSGHQVLEWIHTRPDLARLRVYILSSSGEARDRARAGDAHAAGYFVKPLTGMNLQEILAHLQPVR
jgi:two-component system response regulator